MAEETLVFRCAGFSPALSLLIPTFAFPNAPACVAAHIRRIGNAPLPIFRWLSFGTVLDARLLSMPAPLDQ